MSEIICLGCGKELVLDFEKPLDFALDGKLKGKYVTLFPCAKCGKLHILGGNYLLDRKDQEMFLTKKGIEYFPRTTLVNH